MTTSERASINADLYTRHRKTGLFSTLLNQPLLWGAALTVGVYQAIPYLPVYRGMAERYLCGHPLEYAIMALFCTGMATLLIKALRLVGERAAISARPFSQDNAANTGSPLDARLKLERAIDFLPQRWRNTHLANRLVDVAEYLHSRPNGQGLEDHLKYLADQTSDRVHESYGLVRTISWAVPIIGFLGTVIGITLAIANVTPEQLDTSLSAVTGGLAVAFDTTALSLALSLVLVFGYFLVEQSEQRVLAQVEDIGNRRLAPLCVTPGGTTGNEFMDAQHSASAKIATQTEELLNWQAQLWQESLESMRDRWTESVQHQQNHFNESLSQGMTATLADHEEQLRSVRTEFLDSFRTVAEQLKQVMAEFRESQSTLFAQSAQHSEQICQRGEQAIDVLRSDLNRQVDMLGDQKDVLLQVVTQETELSRLQDRLTENLEALRTTEALEETIHSLNGAVHMLTARVRPSDRKAA
ncbi:MotA/TolQ/ExbB proton channel family protein [Thalassoroseus pseudoceratinae]|uniref:MotA/TolQ/ExbB proton channel family protein n=1 Tax=Thalassoroseus pseudoceratinae TaxID=2713176 RepID=UPI001423C216|nr:MotA/TolQ/ExbB proton channel family protein [Thalassoroseus pseudoceratinae]